MRLAIKLVGIGCLALFSACSRNPTAGACATPDAFAKEYLRAIDAQDEAALSKLIFFPPDSAPDDRKVFVRIHLSFKTFGLKSAQAAPLNDEDKEETSHVQDNARYAFEPAPTHKLLLKIRALPPFLAGKPSFMGVKDGRWYLSMPHKTGPRPPEWLVGKVVELAKTDVTAMIDADLPRRQKVRDKGAQYLAELDLHSEQKIKQTLDADHTATVAVLQMSGSGHFLPKLDGGLKQSAAYKAGPQAWAKAFARFLPDAPNEPKGATPKRLDAEMVKRVVKLTKFYGDVTREIEASSQKIKEAKASGAFDAKGDWDEFWQYKAVQQVGGLNAIDHMVPSVYIAAIERRLATLVERDKQGKATDDDARWVVRLLDVVSGEHGLRLKDVGQTEEENAFGGNSRMVILCDYLSAITRRLDPPRGR